MENESMHPNAIKSRLQKASNFSDKAFQWRMLFFPTLITIHGIIIGVYGITINCKEPNIIILFTFFGIGLISILLCFDAIRRHININEVKASYFKGIGTGTLKKGSKEEETAKTNYETTEENGIKRIGNWSKISTCGLIINILLVILLIFTEK